jgi:hypothetical protein
MTIKYMVVDEANKPMVFCDEQFCYANNDLRSKRSVVHLYTKKKATELVKKTKEFRKTLNIPAEELRKEKYILLPVIL